MKVAFILISYIIYFVFCEPPAPNSQYLPPNDYSTLSENSLGAPPSRSYGAPSSSYGPPQNNRRPPSNSYGPPRPSITAAIVRPPKPVYGVPNEEQSEPAKYQFEYSVKDPQSGNDFGHMEQRDGDHTQGRYYVLLPDGRKQIVNYEADSNGYRPTITYEEASGGGYPSGNGNGYRY